MNWEGEIADGSEVCNIDVDGAWLNEGGFMAI